MGKLILSKGLIWMNWWVFVITRKCSPWRIGFLSTGLPNSNRGNGKLKMTLIFNPYVTKVFLLRVFQGNLKISKTLTQNFIRRWLWQINSRSTELSSWKIEDGMMDLNLFSIGLFLSNRKGREVKMIIFPTRLILTIRCCTMELQL